MQKDEAQFVCMECKKKFKTFKAVEKAASEGCPKCGGGDIELYFPEIFKS